MIRNCNKRTKKDQRCCYTECEYERSIGAERHRTGSRSVFYKHIAPYEIRTLFGKLLEQQDLLSKPLKKPRDIFNLQYHHSDQRLQKEPADDQSRVDFPAIVRKEVCSEKDKSDA